MSAFLRKTDKPKTITTCMQTAQDMLARREHTRAELQQKLSTRDFATADIYNVLDDLQQRNLQNDQRFAEAYSRMRAGRGFGPMRIKLELQERGVAEEIIETILDEKDKLWRELAAKVRNKKFGTALPTDFLEQNKQSKFLIYRGFSFELIRKLLSLA